MRLRSWIVAVAAAAAALVAAAPASARESRPLNIVSETASNGASYRLDLVRVTERVRGRVRGDACLRLTVRGPRKKLLRTRLRCRRTGGFEYRSPSLYAADDRDPDNAPLVFGFADAGLGNVVVPLARGRPAVNAQLRAVPIRFAPPTYVFVARGLEAAPLGVRVIDRDGAAGDGVIFPAR